MNKAIGKYEFIKKYKAAIAAKLSTTQFAQVLGIKRKSLIRQRLRIKDEVGLDLPFLRTDPKKLSDDDVERYDAALSKLEGSIKEDFKFREKTTRDGAGTYVLIAAQNATPIREDFWKCLQIYAEDRDAEIIVIPYRYRNPASPISAGIQIPEDWWSPKLHDHLVFDEIEIGEDLLVLGGVKVQPTAKNPLSTFEGVGGVRSLIVGHPQIERRSVPTLSEHTRKITITTGAITIPNYSDSKAGYTGSHNHNLAALVVEVDEDGDFFMRHLHANDSDGSFYDLDSYYSKNGVTTGHRVEALIPGDSHVEFADDKVYAATYYNPDSILKSLKPKYVIGHDVDDFYRRNHHHKGNDVIQYGKHFFGRDNVEEGLQITANHIDSVIDEAVADVTYVVVAANHMEAFDKWLATASGKDDPENARFFHYMKYHLYRNVTRTATGFETINPFEFWCSNPDQFPGLKNVHDVEFLSRTSSFKLHGIELGYHGDAGPNGARGSLQAYSRMGPKVVIGHSHTPGIKFGAYQVGVSALNPLEYSAGSPSSWLHTHCLIYPDGSRTLVDIVNGKWKAE